LLDHLLIHGRIALQSLLGETYTSQRSVEEAIEFVRETFDAQGIVEATVALRITLSRVERCIRHDTEMIDVRGRSLKRQCCVSTTWFSDGDRTVAREASTEHILPILTSGWQQAAGMSRLALGVPRAFR
jgi:hypothetical protein